MIRSAVTQLLTSLTAVWTLDIEALPLESRLCRKSCHWVDATVDKRADLARMADLMAVAIE